MLGKWARPPGAHDENDICFLSDSVLIVIIVHAVIPLLEGSGGQSSPIEFSLCRRVVSIS